MVLFMISAVVKQFGNYTNAYHSTAGINYLLSEIEVNSGKIFLKPAITEIKERIIVLVYTNEATSLGSISKLDDDAEDNTTGEKFNC